MNKSRILESVTVLLLTATPAIAGGDEVRVIVGFKGEIDGATLEGLGGRTGKVLESANALVATLPAEAIAQLRSNAAIAFVEEDGIFEALGKGGKGKGGGKPPPPQPEESEPWGITRVGGPVSALGIKIGIIDTGIDLDHPDLVDNVKGDVNITRSNKPGDDDNGHGSHVAGTVAARGFNDIGVIGVAYDASLYAIKVLNRRGSGTLGDVVLGIEWTVANEMNIANMSLGTPVFAASLEAACDAADAAGVLLIAAAGNGGPGSISYPAFLASVVSVGATKELFDDLASFSATNADVELSGPGVAVPSTWKGGGYNTISGTSMASPHAAGAAAVIWSTLVSPTNASVRLELELRAEDLGPLGRDDGYGHGLVQHLP